MATFTTSDGVEPHYTDDGDGPVAVPGEEPPFADLGFLK
jgi:hypothetical protein